MLHSVGIHMINFVRSGSFYDFVWTFIVFSIMGWCVESIYMSLCNRKLTNRGFIKAPFCPIYGVGEAFVYFTLRPFAGNYVLLYFAGAILATTWEFLVAKLTIHTLGYVWWDYNNKPFNYQGIICLESTLAWGLYTIVDFAFLHNFVVDTFVRRVPQNVGGVLAFLILSYVLVATLLQGKKAFHGDVEVQENNLASFKNRVHKN